LKLTVDAEYVLSPLEALVGRAHAWVQRVHPLRGAGALVHLTSHAEDGDLREHLVVLRDGECRAIHEPASLTRRRAACAEDPARKAHTLVQSFQLGDGVGLLLSDGWLWFLDPDKDEAPHEISLDAPLPTWAPARWPDDARAYAPVRCGLATDRRVPVVLRHPAAMQDYAAHVALLDVDLEARRARWSMLDDRGHPVAVRHRPNPNYEGQEGHEGAGLCDAAWLGDRLRVFSIGNEPMIGRLGIRDAAVVETGPRGEEPAVLHAVGDGCFGAFVHGFDALLVPQFKTGPRKGACASLRLRDGAEVPLSLRGHADFRPFAARDGRVWLVGGGNGGSWSSWQQLSLRDGDGKPGRIVACTMS
jgi:hypothetical protein